MSWNTAKKRFQFNLEKMSKSLQEYNLKKMNKIYSLPTFDADIPYIVNKKERKTGFEVGIIKGDLVYVTKGKNSGMITTVLQYNSENDTFFLSNITSKKIVPKCRWVENQTSHLVDYPDHILRDNVRLAGKEKDDKGNIKYFVAEELVLRDEYYNDSYKRWLPKRFIKHHEHIEIPWPISQEKIEDGNLSTPPDVALKVTYQLQTISIPPIPSKILSEFRNPYSKHRKRLVTKVQEWKLKAPKMILTDIEKKLLEKKQLLPKKNYKHLSEEIKEYIGNKIANHINSIDNPALLEHLDRCSKKKIPDFEKTLKIIEENEIDKKSMDH